MPSQTLSQFLHQHQAPLLSASPPQLQQRINQPPLANAGTSQTVYGGTVVMLDGRTSYDPDYYAVGITS